MTCVLHQDHGGLGAKTVVFHPGGRGSNPGREFCYFFTFFQTLRAICQFQRSLAIYRLCLSVSTCSRVPLHVFKIHVVLHSHFVFLVWKRPILGYKFEQFLSFFVSNCIKLTYKLTKVVK